MEIQFREGLQGNRVSESNIATIDTSVTNNSPTFSHSSADNILTMPLEEPLLEIPGWAHSWHDGDKGSQHLSFTTRGGAGLSQLSVSIPSGT